MNDKHGDFEEHLRDWLMHTTLSGANRSRSGPV